MRVKITRRHVIKNTITMCGTFFHTCADGGAGARARARCDRARARAGRDGDGAVVAAALPRTTCYGHRHDSPVSSHTTRSAHSGSVVVQSAETPVVRLVKKLLQV